jgi:hypothetical protein
MREVSVRVTVDLKVIIDDKADVQEILDNMSYDFQTDYDSSASVVHMDMWDYAILKDNDI